MSKKAGNPFRRHFGCLTCAKPVTTTLCFALLCAFAAILPVAAESTGDKRIVDMSAFSCGELLGMPLPQGLTVIGWFGGYYAGLANNPKVNLAMAIDKAEHVLAVCREQEATKVMTLFGQEFIPSP